MYSCSVFTDKSFNSVWNPENRAFYRQNTCLKLPHYRRILFTIITLSSVQFKCVTEVCQAMIIWYILKFSLKNLESQIYRSCVLQIHCVNVCMDWSSDGKEWSVNSLLEWNNLSGDKDHTYHALQQRHRIYSTNPQLHPPKIQFTI